MTAGASLRPSARLTRYLRGEHQLWLGRSTSIGRSQPFVDRSNEDGGLEADREFVEATGHRPVALEPVDSALDCVPGLVVIPIESRRPTAGLPASLAVGGLVGRLRNRAQDSPLSQVGSVGPGRVRLIAPHSQGPDTGTSASGAGNPDAFQDCRELGTVTTLTCGHHQRQRPLALLAGKMDLGGEPRDRPKP